MTYVLNSLEQLHFCPVNCLSELILVRACVLKNDGPSDEEGHQCSVKGKLCFNLPWCFRPAHLVSLPHDVQERLGSSFAPVTRADPELDVGGKLLLHILFGGCSSDGSVCYI